VEEAHFLEVQSLGDERDPKHNPDEGCVLGFRGELGGGNPLVEVLVISLDGGFTGEQ
jgi:hypothetical protein